MRRFDLCVQLCIQKSARHSLLTLNAAEKEKRCFQNESQRQQGAAVWLDCCESIAKGRPYARNRLAAEAASGFAQFFVVESGRHRGGLLGKWLNQSEQGRGRVDR
jgi:hypothetical protein